MQVEPKNEIDEDVDKFDPETASESEYYNVIGIITTQ